MRAVSSRVMAVVLGMLAILMPVPVTILDPILSQDNCGKLIEIRPGALQNPRSCGCIFNDRIIGGKEGGLDTRMAHTHCSTQITCGSHTWFTHSKMRSITSACLAI